MSWHLVGVDFGKWQDPTDIAVVERAKQEVGWGEPAGRAVAEVMTARNRDRLQL